jgi:broad specificity phosphatase PhoE
MAHHLPRSSIMGTHNGPKRLFLMRHGQAQHNPRAEAAHKAGCSHDEFMRLMKEDDALDASLTGLGVRQAQNAISSPSIAERLRHVELVAGSPLSRAMNTAELAIQGVNNQLTNNGAPCPNDDAVFSPKRVCLEQWREINGLLLNAKRRPRREINQLFPNWDLSQLDLEEDELWNPDVMESQHECAERGYQGLLWLMNQPEQNILLVGHGGIFRFLFQLHPQIQLVDDRSEDQKSNRTVDARFANCELREYTVEAKQATGTPPLVDSKTMSSKSELKHDLRPVIELVEVA